MIVPLLLGWSRNDGGLDSTTSYPKSMRQEALVFFLPFCESIVGKKIGWTVYL